MRPELPDRLSSTALIPQPRVPLDGDVPKPAGDTRPDVFVGRAGELSVLEDALRDVRSRHPRMVLVAGAAGIGKTALAERFVRGRGDLQVVRCGGERECPTSFGVIDQLFRG